MCFASLHVYVACCQQREEEDLESLGYGVTDSYKPPWGYQDLNRVPLQEEPVLLTTELKTLSSSLHSAALTFSKLYWALQIYWN